MAEIFQPIRAVVKLDLKKNLFKSRKVACQRTPFGVVL